MLRSQKEDVVAELVERLRTADTLIVADYRGLTHAELNGVRTELLKHGARFTVVKNTLTKRAADAAGVEALLEFVTGPTAIAFVHDGDMVAVARTLNETARATRRLELKGAVLGGRAIGAEAVRDLAELPPVDVLHGQVLGAIVAPLTSLLSLVAAPLQNLVGLIDARIDQLQAQVTEAPPPAEPGPSAAPAGDEASEPETDLAEKLQPDVADESAEQTHEPEASSSEAPTEE
jgi:large subunit ribosomal protein L10